MTAMEASGLFLTILAVTGFYLPPVVAAAISVVYFYASPRTEPLFRRIVSSAHGAAIAFLYVAAFLVPAAGFDKRPDALPYLILLIIPALLIVASFILFRGRKRLHGLQIINIACLFWTGFVGSMAVTGRWL